MSENFLKIEKDFRTLCTNPMELRETTKKFFNIMIDELTLETVFEIHRNFKLGLTEFDKESRKQDDELCDGDVSRQPTKKSQAFTCPNCNCKVVSNNFAPHLSACMHIRRKNASRNNTHRTNSAKEQRNDAFSCISDDEGYSDWNYGGKRKKKKNNNKRSVKKPKNSPKKNGNDETNITTVTYDTMSEEEKRALLTKYCGVVSEHTKKICSRSLRCNSHSDEKRRALRAAVIKGAADADGTDSVVDVEGDDTLESALNDLILILQDNSNTSSPADSASNSNSSSSSKKRDKSRTKSGEIGGSGKNSKRDRASPNV